MQGVEPQNVAVEPQTNEAEPEKSIKSLRSKVTAWVFFKNATKNYVDIYWINFIGKKVLYQTLRPGGQSWQHTFESHPWIACKYDSEDLLALNKRLVYIPLQPIMVTAVTSLLACQVYIPSGSDLVEVAIHEPACLPWSQETHARYPESFKLAVKELLLSHSRKWCEQPEAQSGGLQVRRSARLAAKRLRQENDPLGLSLAEVPPELIPKIVKAMAPPGVLDLEPVTGENALPGYDTLHIVR